MEEASLLAPLAFIILSLMAGAFLKVFLKSVNVPYTVGLFVLGMVVGTLNVKGYLIGFPVISDSIDMACDIDPDMILNIFLPILIFSAAYELNVHIFKRTLTNATLLAVPGLVISMILTAVLMIGISFIAPAYVNWNWTYALMFGALISATDPVAVVSLLGELGASKRFSTLIDGESLLNDGTGIVLFMLMFAPFTSSVETAHASPVLSFLIVVFGGLLIGYILAKAYLYYASTKSVKSDTMLQSSVMILLSYLTFILAQDIFKLSGVIALVAFGLVVAYHSVDKLEVKTQHFMKELWALMSYVANTLIFIIIGVIIAVKVNFTWHDFAVMVTVYIGINLVRMAMIALLYPIMKRCGYGLTKRESLILTWGALRGALGLTLALMVYNTEAIDPEVRRQVLGLTAGIVTMTLVINATTIKWMLNKLGLIDVTPAQQLIDAEVKAQLHHRSKSYLESLRGESATTTIDWGRLSMILPEDGVTPEHQPSSDSLLAGLRMQLLSNERQIISSLYNRGIISFKAHGRLIDAIDIIEDGDGYITLDQRIETLQKMDVEMSKSAIFWRKRLSYFGLCDAPTDDILHYEFAFGVKCAQDQMVEMIDKLMESRLYDAAQNANFKLLRSEVEALSAAATLYLDSFTKDSTELYERVLTERYARMMEYHERETIEEFVESGVIDEDGSQALLEDLNHRVKELNRKNIE